MRTGGSLPEAEYRLTVVGQIHIMIATCCTLKRDRILRSSCVVGNSASFCSELRFRVAVAFCLLSYLICVSNTYSAKLLNQALTLTNTHLSVTSSTLLCIPYGHFLSFTISLLLLMTGQC